MSVKILDQKNRWRSKTVAFRMSPEEAEQLDINVKLSGLAKQDYLIRRSLQREIVVIGNPRVYKALRNQLTEVLSELQSIADGELRDELIDTIELITVTLSGLQGETNGK